MRIGINGRFLIAKRTGVQRAAYNLVRALVEVDRVNEYFIFTGSEQLGNPDWDYPNVKVIPAHLREGWNFRNHLWEQFALPRLARRHRIDILHSPANLAPLFYRGRSIVHIHDLCFVVNPQWYSFSFHTVYNLVIPLLARRATRVITNSNNSRNDLLQFCKVEAERVALIYWAVDQTFAFPSQDSQSEAIEAPKDGYILYVGSLEPRKNIRTLVEAFELMRARHPNLETKLILIGGESPLFADVRLKVKTYKEDVVFKGFVNDRTLREYYRNAMVVAYPSLYEGFGLPPLEAMASGTPVVTSNTSSIPEVVGDAALMVSPYDVDELARTLAAVLQSPELRQELRAKGLQQVKKFNWQRVARNILGVYHEVHYTPAGSEGTSQAYLPFAKWLDLVKWERNSHPPVPL